MSGAVYVTRAEFDSRDEPEVTVTLVRLGPGWIPPQQPTPGDLPLDFVQALADWTQSDPRIKDADKGSPA